MASSNWSYCMPDDYVEHFSERSEERKHLFEDAASRLPTTELSPLVWAFFQVGDLEQLRSITQSDLSWLCVYDKYEPSIFERRSLDSISLWKQRQATNCETPAPTKRSFSEAFSPDSPSLSLDSYRTYSGASPENPRHGQMRDIRVAHRCKKRDHGLCVVSKSGAADACHIYPWSAHGGRSSERVDKFWGFLEAFWPQDKVNSWYRKIFPDDGTKSPRGTETVENMLTLTTTLRRFHSEGAFALRPVRISDDKTQLELEFHWLVRQGREPDAKVSLLEQPPSSRDRGESEPGFSFCRFDKPARHPLVSGTRFLITTDDPKNKPLPDPGLMEMQWHLQRVFAMSGATGWRDEDFKSHVDEDCEEDFEEDSEDDSDDDSVVR